MKNKTRTKTTDGFFDKATSNPFILGLLAGLYPMVFYYSRNFQMNNSWEQLLFFIGLFLILPIAIFVILKVLSKYSFTLKFKKYLFPFFSVFLFLFFLKLILYSGLQKKMIVGIFVVSAVATYFLHRYLKKWLIIQTVLAAIGLFSLLPILFKNFTYTPEWTGQPDNISEVTFNPRPNIYYIQPDGYVNFSTLKSGDYKVDNSKFESYLEQNNFTNYPDFRSNYISTLTSNSATFMMKHHYYNFGDDLDEMLGARKAIITQNPVLSAFKNNNYKTHFITEKPYLVVNRPKPGYDFINFEYSSIPYISTGLNMHKDVYPDLEKAMDTKSKEGNFFFIEIFDPSHIVSLKSASKGKMEEREKWLDKLTIANQKLEQMIDLIIERDPQALIMIMADHGGFVGLDYTLEVYSKTEDPDIINSAFGSMLSIRWPDNEEPPEAKQLKSSVNVFRILFSYLGSNQKYLEHLQEDKSYIILKSGADPGVYEYVDNEGNIVCNKISKT